MIYPMPKVPKPCAAEGCTNLAFARGWCRRHYGQMWRHGEISTRAAVPSNQPVQALPRADELAALIGEERRLLELTRGAATRLERLARIRQLSAEREDAIRNPRPVVSKEWSRGANHYRFNGVPTEELQRLKALGFNCREIGKRVGMTSSGVHHRLNAASARPASAVGARDKVLAFVSTGSGSPESCAGVSAGA